jgi:nicotinamidase-related amidase
MTTLHLRLRSREETPGASGTWREALHVEDVAAQSAALLLCDVWDNHWCTAAVRRLTAMTPRMEAVVSAARRKGVRIIHAPSETMAFYAEAPQRLAMLALPRVPMPPEKPMRHIPLPIDDSDGGCDSEERPEHKAWTRQHPAITIAPEDLISDNGDEIYSYLVTQSVSHLISLGVHTNMCILRRSFGILRMTRLGVRCVLVRDLTDAMYNPAMPPNVSHDAGTALVVEHIERHCCPTILSDDLRGRS